MSKTLTGRHVRVCAEGMYRSQKPKNVWREGKGKAGRGPKMPKNAKTGNEKCVHTSKKHACDVEYIKKHFQNAQPQKAQKVLENGQKVGEGMSGW